MMDGDGEAIFAQDDRQFDSAAVDPYSVMPIPYHMALTWFLGSVIEAAVGGVILGAIVREGGAG